MVVNAFFICEWTFIFYVLSFWVKIILLSLIYATGLCFRQKKTFPGNFLLRLLWNKVKNNLLNFFHLTLKTISEGFKFEVPYSLKSCFYYCDMKTACTILIKTASLLESYISFTSIFQYHRIIPKTPSILMTQGSLFPRAFTEYGCLQK